MAGVPLLANTVLTDPACVVLSINVDSLAGEDSSHHGDHELSNAASHGQSIHRHHQVKLETTIIGFMSQWG